MCRYQQDCLETPSAACHWGAISESSIRAAGRQFTTQGWRWILCPFSFASSQPLLRQPSVEVLCRVGHYSGNLSPSPVWTASDNSHVFVSCKMLWSSPGRGDGKGATHLFFFFLSPAVVVCIPLVASGELSAPAYCIPKLGTWCQTTKLVSIGKNSGVKGLREFWSRNESRLRLGILLYGSFSFYLPTAQKYGCLTLWAPAGTPGCKGLFLQVLPCLLGSMPLHQEAIPLFLADHHDFIDECKSWTPAPIWYMWSFFALVPAKIHPVRVHK